MPSISSISNAQAGAVATYKSDELSTLTKQKLENSRIYMQCKKRFALSVSCGILQVVRRTNVRAPYIERMFADKQQTRKGEKT